MIEYAWKEASKIWHLFHINNSFFKLFKSDLKGDNEFVDNELLTFSWKLDLLYHIEKERQGLLNVD